MNRKNTDPKSVRSAVSQDYGRAVKKPTEGCCCQPAQKGVVAKLAGYTDDELAALPPQAVVNSFGCGNPLAFSGVKPGETVLDLGCGAGIDLLLAARKVGPSGKVIGIDMTDEMLAKARENITASGLTNVEVRKGIIEELPVESASVDWVISNCVINLSPEKEKVFREITRVLRPGGTMTVSDIVAEELPPEIANNRHLYSSCLAGAISEAAYIDGLRKAGLDQIEVRERLVYDSTQLAGFIGSELKEADPSPCCGHSDRPVEGDVAAWTSQLQEKVWSIKIFARKKLLR